jgi:outer membrane lipoprotein-sorting protein
MRSRQLPVAGCQWLLSGFLGLAVACGTAQPAVSGPAPEPQALLEQARKAHAGPQTLTCDAKAFVQAQQGGRFELHVSVKRPDSIRIEALTPVGDPAAVLVATAGKFALIDLRNNVYYRGPATPQNLSRLIPVPMTPQELVAVLTGAIPELPGAQPTASKRQGDGSQITFAKQGVSQQVSLGADLRVTQVQRSDAQGKLIWAVKLDQHDDASGSQLPMLLHLDAPDAKTQVDLRLRNVVTGKQPPASAFLLAVPQGMRVEEVQ